MLAAAESLEVWSDALVEVVAAAVVSVDEGATVVCVVVAESEEHPPATSKKTISTANTNAKLFPMFPDISLLLLGFWGRKAPHRTARGGT
jgi:hypothetical protein